jgi:hypothetical protein
MSSAARVASMTRGGNDVDDRHTRYCSPPWHRPPPAHPTGSAVAACAGPVSPGPGAPPRPPPPPSLPVIALRTSARIVTGARGAEGPNSAESVLALPPVGPPLILVSQLPRTGHHRAQREWRSQPRPEDPAHRRYRQRCWARRRRHRSSLPAEVPPGPGGAPLSVETLPRTR